MKITLTVELDKTVGLSVQVDDEVLADTDNLKEILENVMNNLTDAVLEQTIKHMDIGEIEYDRDD